MGPPTATAVAVASWWVCCGRTWSLCGLLIGHDSIVQRSVVSLNHAAQAVPAAYAVNPAAAGVALLFTLCSLPVCLGSRSARCKGQQTHMLLLGCSVNHLTLLCCTELSSPCPDCTTQPHLHSFCCTGPLKLERPLVTFDIESTGLNVSKDRILEIAAVKVWPDGKVRLFRVHWL